MSARDPRLLDAETLAAVRLGIGMVDPATWTVRVRRTDLPVLALLDHIDAVTPRKLLVCTDYSHWVCPVHGIVSEDETAEGVDHSKGIQFDGDVAWTGAYHCQREATDGHPSGCCGLPVDLWDFSGIHEAMFPGRGATTKQDASPALNRSASHAHPPVATSSKSQCWRVTPEPGEPT